MALSIEQIVEGIHIVGQLLEHHPTTGAAARDAKGVPISSGKSPEAACWCVVGACTLVATQMYNSNSGRILWEHIESKLRTEIVKAWEGEGTTPETRLDFARRLQNYTGGAL